MNAIERLFETEPTLVIGAIGGVVDAAIVAGVQFGLPITADQKQAIDGLVLAVGALVTLLIIRSQVTPAPAAAPTPPTATPGASA